MPIVKMDEGEGFALICINKHGEDAMRRIPSTLLLEQCDAAKLDLGLRCFYCTICGYAEFYVGYPLLPLAVADVAKNALKQEIASETKG